MIPFGGRGELPYFIPGDAETLSGEIDQHAEAEQTAYHGGQFGADCPGQNKIGHDKAGGSHEAVFPGAESFGPGFVFAEEAGHEAQHENGQDICHGQVHQRGILAHDLVEHGGIAQTEGGDAEAFHRFQALEYGSAHRAEGYRYAVKGQTDNRGAERRKTEAQQERGGQGRRRAEACRAFNEGREHEADDDGLKTAVGADAFHACLNGFHAPAVFQRVVDEEGAEHDNQHAESGDSAFNAQSGKAQRRLSPDCGCKRERGEQRERHGPGGRPAQAGHENEGDKNGDEGEKCQETDRHGSSSVKKYATARHWPQPGPERLPAFCMSRAALSFRAARRSRSPRGAGCAYFFMFSASSSAICETLTPRPCFSAPPRICMTQPGQSITTREAPVSLMLSSFFSSSRAEISGNFME